MTALTADAQRVEKEGKLVAMPVAVAKIYKGAILMRNPAGYVLPAASLSGAVFAGVAYEAKDNTNGSAGDEVVRSEVDAPRNRLHPTSMNYYRFGDHPISSLKAEYKNDLPQEIVKEIVEMDVLILRKAS